MVTKLYTLSVSQKQLKATYMLTEIQLTWPVDFSYKEFVIESSELSLITFVQIS